MFVAHRFALALLLVACGENAAQPVAITRVAQPPEDCGAAAPSASYVPAAAWSGRAANLPAVPTLPVTPIRIGDVYTVYGAVHTLRSRDFARTLEQPITITGYIALTNLESAPKCALHKTGKADPPNCVTEIPTFSIGDEKGVTSQLLVRVMGWASNFANVYEAYVLYQHPPGTLYRDLLWATDVPYPLPAVGAKVKVTGRYGAIFSKASSGIVADPRLGIMTVEHVEVVDPAPFPARFQQLR